MKECKNCYGKGFATVMVGADVAHGDFDYSITVVKPQRIEKVPCTKCGAWRDMLVKKHFKS